MKIFVKAKPNSKEERIQKIEENSFLVAVKEPPVKGMANKAIVKKLSDYFKVPVSNIILVSGFSSKTKVFEIKQQQQYNK